MHPGADEDEDYDLVKTHLDALAGSISAKDAKIDKVEAQMVDSYDNEKKVAVLSRIQACSFFGEFLQK